MTRRLVPWLLVLSIVSVAAAQQSGTSYGTRFRFTATGCVLWSGSGSPEGARVGSVCDVYVRADASGSNPALYTKLTGLGTTTGWVAVAQAVQQPWFLYAGAARCQGNTAVSFFNLPSGVSAPTAACSAGTNIERAWLEFGDDRNRYAQLPFHLADDTDVSAGIELDLYWSTAATSGDVKWLVQTACVGTNEASDPAFNAAQTITQAALGNAQYKNKGEIAVLTLTGCAVDETLFLKVSRDGTATGDTIAATAMLWALELEGYRIQ